jgi:hypothetical protein
MPSDLELPELGESKREVFDTPDGQIGRRMRLIGADQDRGKTHIVCRKEIPWGVVQKHTIRRIGLSCQDQRLLVRFRLWFAQEFQGTHVDDAIKTANQSEHSQDTVRMISVGIGKNPLSKREVMD